LKLLDEVKDGGKGIRAQNFNAVAAGQTYDNG